MKKPLILLVPVMVFALAGCTNNSTMPSVVTTADAGPATASASPSATPTPTGTPLTVKQAADAYLDAICPANATQLQVDRALAAYPVDMASVRTAAKKANAAATTTMKALSDTSVLWPGTAEQDRYLVAEDLHQIGNYMNMVQFSTDADSVTALTVPSAGSEVESIRQSLGIDGDRVLGCVGHGYTAAFPKGYPKVVKVASLPYQVRSWMEGSAKKAVALAPGVWQKLDPGATVSDAVSTGGADGFCGSKKAFERKYLYGEELSGACW